jgi:hypothetical protein
LITREPGPLPAVALTVKVPAPAPVKDAMITTIKLAFFSFLTKPAWFLASICAILQKKEVKMQP